MQSAPMKRIQDARLYGIVDLGYVTAENVEHMTDQLCLGGVDLLQLRAKKLVPQEIERLARLMLPITRSMAFRW